MSTITGYGNVTQTYSLHETYTSTAASKISLQREALERLQKVQDTVLQYAKKIPTDQGDKWMTFSSTLSSFLETFKKSLEANQMSLSEIYYGGSVANHIVETAENYHKIHVGIKINPENGLFNIIPWILANMCTHLSSKGSDVRGTDFLRTIYENDLSFPDFYHIVLDTAPKVVHLYLFLNEESHVLFSHLGENLQVVQDKEGQTSLRAVKGYDLEGELHLLAERTFQVASLEEARSMENGLFCYVAQLIKGRLPIPMAMESAFCEGFCDQYPQPDSLNGSAKLIEVGRTFLAGYHSLERQAFLFTFENILSRSNLAQEKKDQWIAILHTLLPLWEEKKRDFFAQAVVKGIGIHDSENSSLPPRYQFQVQEAQGHTYTALCEPLSTASLSSKTSG